MCHGYSDLDGEDEVGQARIAAFKAAYPSVTVTNNKSDFDAQQFLTALASGNPPDLVCMDRNLTDTSSLQDAGSMVGVSAVHATLIVFIFELQASWSDLFKPLIHLQTEASRADHPARRERLPTARAVVSRSRRSSKRASAT